MTRNPLSRALLLGALAAALAGPPALAQPSKLPPMTADAQAVKRLVDEKFPGMPIRTVVKTKHLGLYEVVLDDQIIYVDPKVSVVLTGSLLDANSKTNLTQARLRELNRVDLAELPLQWSFKRVRGKGERNIYLFSDVDCPFCQRIEDEFKGLDNVTIHTFLYPIDTLHPEAAAKSARIWCAPDRGAAFDTYYGNGGKLPDNDGKCANPVKQTQVLGQKLRITATPTLVLADGSVLPGALPAAQLEAAISAAEAAAKKPAAK